MTHVGLKSQIERIKDENLDYELVCPKCGFTIVLPTIVETEKCSCPECDAIISIAFRQVDDMVCPCDGERLVHKDECQDVVSSIESGVRSGIISGYRQQSKHTEEKGEK